MTRIAIVSDHAAYDMKALLADHPEDPERGARQCQELGDGQWPVSIGAPRERRPQQNHVEGRGAGAAKNSRAHRSTGECNARGKLRSVDSGAAHARPVRARAMPRCETLRRSPAGVIVPARSIPFELSTGWWAG